ncbi:MAG TPA: TonB-dependent receptor plug domain-containing protein, partial [Prolixibacteraceae bacterium]|nr:TonB-dependent receptor plug domain-containing protein [Prolixibacteraceae bacterium]
MRYPALVLLSIFVLFAHTTLAQVRTVSGVVTNSENDKPLPGVSVTVKNTTIGTITNEDGHFMLHLPKNTQLLVFSFIGMQTKDVPINSKRLEVELKPGYIGVDEVLVMGYTRKERSETTGSVVQVNGDEIANIPVTSFEQALQGKVPGLVVATTSGTPGSFHDIRIRGVGSITAGNDPLIVVDGVPVINEDFRGVENQSSLGTLSALNSYDIESVTVLKDASATSMFGARGANGVIVVTTKKG